MAKKARKKAKPVKAAKRKVTVKKAKKATKSKAKKKAPAKAKRVVAKKAQRPAAKKAKPAKRRTKPKTKDVIGEGNYTAARNFRKKETAFIDNNRDTIARKAKEAEAALDGPEGAALERAREETAAHAKE